MNGPRNNKIRKKKLHLSACQQVFTRVTQSSTELTVFLHVLPRHSFPSHPILKSISYLGHNKDNIFGMGIYMDKYFLFLILYKEFLHSILGRAPSPTLIKNPVIAGNRKRNLVSWVWEPTPMLWYSTAEAREIWATQ